MNRRPSNLMSLEKAIEGFIHFKTAEGLSDNTLVSYRHNLGLFCNRQNRSLELVQVTAAAITEHLAWLRSEYKPKRIDQNRAAISNKTLRNHWVSLKSFFRWVAMEFDIQNLMDKIPAPNFERRPIHPLMKEEIEELLKLCQYSAKAKTKYRRSFAMRRPTANRDVALIMTLLDTWVRAGELCALDIGDLDLRSGQLIIKHGPTGGAKGGQGRVVFLGRQTRRAVWRYLASREDEEQLDAPLFVNTQWRRLTPNSLRLLIKRLAKRAGIEKCHPHLFRHTFAITYLRSGGDVFTLQSLLAMRHSKW